MNGRSSLFHAVAAAAVLAGCASAPNGGADSLPPLIGGPAVAVERPAPSAADVHFMSGMIPHHAQAVIIADWAMERAADRRVRVLAERMAVGQADEIALIQDWLRQNNQTVPAADATHHVMDHGGMQHPMLMPGMLTDEEMARLDAATGVAFDRLFLTLMIRHHEGAIIMVNELFASEGAAREPFIFEFASHVYADQTTEIHHMQQILASLDGGSSSPEPGDS
jgi:uncharacterized protein (DUF305 family)